MPLPADGRLAGIDFGTVRVGIALSDPGRTLCSPYECYVRRNESLDAAYFSRLAEEEAIAGFVVGLPLHLSGDDSQKSIEARAFGGWLVEKTKRPVVFFDERFSTAMAKSLMAEGKLTKKKRKQRLDNVAAYVILTSFLESTGGRQDRPIDDR